MQGVLSGKVRRMRKAAPHSSCLHPSGDTIMPQPGGTSPAASFSRVFRAPALPHERFGKAVQGKDYLEAVCRLGDVTGLDDGAPHSTVRFPLTYSYVDDPEPALRVLWEVAARSAGAARELWFAQEQCTQVDLCAESVTAALALIAKQAGLRVDGGYPELKQPRLCVAGFGTPTVIGGYAPEPSDVLVLVPLQRVLRPETRAGGESGRSASFATDDLIERLDHVFEGRPLRAELSSSLSDFLGEALFNADEHGDGDWWYAASCRPASGETRARCQIVLFHFGDSMAQSLERMDHGERLWRDCEDLLAHHEHEGYFHEGGWTPENLMVLIALQHCVTRYGAEQEPDRGVGTLRMIQFYEHLTRTSLASSAPRMCIVTGRTQILFDGRYRLKESRKEGRDHMYDIAFNPPNDLLRPPNPASVRNLKEPFPGTLITAKFTLEDSHFEPPRHDDDRDVGEGVNRLVGPR